MRYMHVLHQKVVATYERYTFGCCATGYGYILADAVIIAYLTGRNLTFEFQILWLGGNAGTGKYLISIANPRPNIDCYTVLKHIIITDNGISINVTERADNIVVSKFCLGMNVGKRTDLIHISLKLIYLFFTIWAVNVASETT